MAENTKGQTGPIAPQATTFVGHEVPFSEAYFTPNFGPTANAFNHSPGSIQLVLAELMRKGIGGIEPLVQTCSITNRLGIPGLREPGVEP